MALTKQSVNVNFAKGLDTKTDPNQVQLGNFLVLENAIFDKGGLLQKRNGFKLLPSLPDNSSTFLTTHNNNLVALGNNLQVLSTDTSQWLTKGQFQDVEVKATSLVRTTSSQLNVDTAIAPNMAACTVYLNSSDGLSYYTIQDSVTGEILIAPKVITGTAGAGNTVLARVCSLGSYFIITFLCTVAGAVNIEYIAIPIFNPQLPFAPVSMETDVISLTAGYDIAVSNNQMFFAYASNRGGTSVRVSFLDSVLLPHVFVTIPGFNPQLVSVTIDPVLAFSNVYVTFWETSSGDANTQIFDLALNSIGGTHTVLTATQLHELTSAAFDGINNIFYEVINTYSYSAVRTDFIKENTISNTGVVGPFIGTNPTGTLIRSVGIGSKAFIINGTAYLLINYGAPADPTIPYAGSLEPTYFLMDKNANIIAKIAAGSSATYVFNQVLPQGNVIDSTVQIGYLFKDLLAPVNKVVNSTQTTGIYSQTGINLGSFFLNSGNIDASEIAGSLMLTGGFPWMYDGTFPVEHQFFVWPEDIAATPTNTGGGLAPVDYFYQVTYEWTDAEGNIHRSAPSIPLEVNLTTATQAPITFTSTFAMNDITITVSSVAGLFVGQQVTGLGIAAPVTTITAINGSTVTLSLPTTSAETGATLTTIDTFSVTLNIPTLRLTYKQAPNGVRIVIYRWSTDQEIFYQITSIPNPILNDTTIDSITYVDTQASPAIIGNLIIYTSGGVLEDIQAPASTVSTLYKSRWFIVDAEDRNLIWYSKQVIENTPVEMTDLQTIYVAPTIGAQGSTGPITAISAMDDKLIIFKTDAIYYVTGNGPDITGANNDFSDPVYITGTVGCADQRSIVFMPNGLMFQSDKGIWLLGRDLSTQYIGAPAQQFNTQVAESSLAIPGTNQVRFTLSGGDVLMYDYYYGQWGNFTDIPGLSSTLFQGLHTFIDKFGRVFQESPGVYLDASRPVLMAFTTAWAQLAGLQGYQRAYFFYLLGTYYSPHTLSLSMAFDYNPAPQQQVLIQPVNFNGFYGDDPLYGDSSPYGGANSAVEQWRVFLSTQKCESIQITLQENFDNTIGPPAGAGLTLSGINLVYGIKKSYTTLKPTLSVG